MKKIFLVLCQILSLFEAGSTENGRFEEIEAELVRLKKRLNIIESSVLVEKPYFSTCAQNSQFDPKSSKKVNYQAVFHLSSNLEEGGLDICSGEFTAGVSGTYSVSWSSSSREHMTLYETVYDKRNGRIVGYSTRPIQSIASPGSRSFLLSREKGTKIWLNSWSRVEDVIFCVSLVHAHEIITEEKENTPRLTIVPVSKDNTYNISLSSGQDNYHLAQNIAQNFELNSYSSSQVCHRKSALDWRNTHRTCEKECMKGKARECDAGCSFDYESLGECKEMPYGYVNTQGGVSPCFFLRFEVEHYWKPGSLGSWAWNEPDLLPPKDKFDQFQVNCMAEIDSSDADLYVELVKMMNQKRNPDPNKGNSTYLEYPSPDEIGLFEDFKESSESNYNASNYNASDSFISSSQLPYLSEPLLQYFVERKELFEDLAGVGESINDFLKLQEYLKTELATVYIDGIKTMNKLKEKSIRIFNRMDKYEKTRFNKLSKKYLDDDWNTHAFGEVIDFLKVLEELDEAVADKIKKEIRIGVNANEEQITKLTIDSCERIVKKYNAGHKLCLYFSNKGGSGEEIMKFLHILELINYLETGEKLPAVSSEVEDYMLACENAPPESGLGVFANNQLLVEKLLSYGEDLKKFVRVKKLLSEYISTKNNVRMTYYPKSQGFPKKYFPMTGNEESPYLAIKLHFEEKTRLTPGQEVHAQCSAWYQGREPEPQIVKFKIRIQ